MSEYLIPVQNFDDFTFKLEKLKRKSLKYSNTLEYVNHGIVLVKNLEDEATPLSFYKVEVKGIVGVKGWEPVAKIEKLSTGNLVKPLTNDFQSNGEYNHTDIICEHCGKRISRKYTYLVRNTETNEIKQVGKTCLKDYTGIDIEDLALYESLEKTVSSYDPLDCSVRIKHFDVRDYVRIVIALCIKNDGYYIRETSRMHKYTTIRTSATAYNVIKRGYSYGDYVDKMCDELDIENQEVTDILNSCIEYVKNCDDENLKVCFDCDYAPFDFMPNIAEVVFRFYKDIDDIPEVFENEFYGEVGDKFELDVTDFQKAGHFYTELSNGYTRIKTYIYTFRYNDTLFKWLTSKELEDKEKLRIKGTIKFHSVYKNVRETLVTRCKIL